MNSLLARKKSTSSLRRKGSESSAATPSDEKPREEKSAPYKHRRYEILLGTKGSFMRDSDAGITDESIRLYQSLLDGNLSPLIRDSRMIYSQNLARWYVLGTKPRSLWILDS